MCRCARLFDFIKLAPSISRPDKSPRKEQGTPTRRDENMIDKLLLGGLVDGEREEERNRLRAGDQPLVFSLWQEHGGGGRLTRG